MTLIALLPKDRTQLGRLEVWNNGTLLSSFPCYGKADNERAAKEGNPNRNPLLPFGDTPLGTWNVNPGIIRKEVDTYGPHPVLMLWPTGGDAMKAYGPKFRRNGIWIHGGSSNGNGLRPTYGCLRVHDGTMARLHELSARYGRITTLETKEA